MGKEYASDQDTPVNRLQQTVAQSVYCCEVKACKVSQTSSFLTCGAQYQRLPADLKGWDRSP